MVQSIVSLLLLPALALGAPHAQHKWHHSTVTESFAVSTSAASSPTASSSAPSATPSAAYSTSANLTTRSPVASPAPAAGAQAGQVFLKNSCSYEVSLQPFPGPGCYARGASTVSPGGTWTDVLTECSAGNTALKVYKEGTTKPMQFEYGLQGGMVWYDMSFIDCLASGYDFSNCAGAGWSMSSNSNCHAYSCSGGEECCTQGYCDPDGSAISPAPNCGCGPDQGYTENELGITIELCAS